MILVSSLGCGLLSGLANGYLSLQNTLDDYIEDMRYPDAFIETEVMTRDVTEKLSELPGVEAADARLVGNLTMVGKGGVFYSMQAMSYSETEFQGTYYWEKSDKEAEFPILIEYRFSKLNDIHAGDEVELRADNRSWKCMVRAVIGRPEMIAFHKLGAMTVVSTDIGYVYIPDELLSKVDDPQYEDAKSQWEKNSEEYQRQKKEAEDQRDNALDQLDEAEKTLEEKRAELAEKLSEAEAKKQELLTKLDEVDAGLAELEKKEKELAEKKAELDKSAEDLRQGRAKLDAGREELRQKKALLDSTKAALTSSKTQLLDQLNELKTKEQELAKKKAELKAARQEIAKKLRELEDSESQLLDTKAELLEKRQQLGTLRETVDTVRGYADAVTEIISMSEDAPDPYELVQKASDEISAMLSDTDRMGSIYSVLSDETVAEGLLASVGITKSKLEAVIKEYYSYTEKMQACAVKLSDLMNSDPDPDAVRQLVNEIIRESRSSWERFSENFEMPKVDLDKIIGKLDDSINEIDNGLGQIEDGSKQIAEGRQQIAEKQREADDGAAQIAEGEKQLDESGAALSEGLAKIADGLSQVDAGYSEYEKYERELLSEEKKLKDGQAEYDEYYAQYLEGQKTLTETREDLLKAKDEIEAGLREIEKAAAEGKASLQDGEDELQNNRDEADSSWLDVLRRFNDVEDELRKAGEQLDEWKGYDQFCNQFLLRVKPGADPYSILTDAESIIGRDKIKKSYTYDDSSAKHSRDVNVEPLEIMSLYVPAVFFVVSLIAEFLFMSFMIRQCRREIGILRALGYSKNQIVGLFCCINILVSAGAVLLGQCIGFGVTRFIGTFFRDFFYLHYFNYSIHWVRVLISILLTVVVGQIATVFSTGYVSRIHPSEAMSRPSPAASSHEGRLLSRLRIPPFMKYCISSLLRNKKRLVFSIVCLSSSVVLIFASFSFDLSKNLILSDRFEDRIHYDCEIYLDSVPDSSLLDRLTASGLVGDKEVIYYYSKTITGNGASREQIIKAVPGDLQLISIFDENRDRLSPPEQGILLEKHTADPLKVSAGDTVLIEGKQIPVAGITEEYESRSQYISLSTAQALGKPDMCSVICKVDKENEVALMELLSKEDSYIYSSFTAKSYAGIESAFRAFGICALIALAFAVTIGMVIVVNTICTNLQEQKKELCVLRTLGFQYSGLSLRLMTQAGVYYLFACIIGIPAGTVVTKFILNKLEVEDRSYPFVNDFRAYLFTLLLVLLYVFVSHMISMRMVKKWDIVETVKDKE